MAAKSAKMSVYEMVTSRILSALESGTVPWQKPWKSADGELAQNLKSKKPYRGVNQWLVSLSAMSQGFTSPYWVTFKQAKEMGGSVKKGEKQTVVTFFKPVSKENSKDGKAYLILRYYGIFNVEQCEGLEGKIPAPIPVEDRKPFSPIDTAQAILDGMPNPPKLSHGGSRAFYAPLIDSVTLPNQEDFDTAENYYCTAFHEFAHATGHESRLKREFGATFGNEKYSKEELIAEMSAAMLCGIAGIENTTLDNSASYIAGWYRKLSDDPKLLVSAASKAQKAADYILDTTWENPTESED